MGLFSNLVFCLVFFSKNLKKNCLQKRGQRGGRFDFEIKRKALYDSLSNKRFYSFFLPIAQTQRAF